MTLSRIYTINKTYHYWSPADDNVLFLHREVTFPPSPYWLFGETFLCLLMSCNLFFLLMFFIWILLIWVLLIYLMNLFYKNMNYLCWVRLIETSFGWWVFLVVLRHLKTISMILDHCLWCLVLRMDCVVLLLGISSARSAVPEFPLAKPSNVQGPSGTKDQTLGLAFTRHKLTFLTNIFSSIKKYLVQEVYIYIYWLTFTIMALWILA